ncbi:zinc ribbon domain-containing protein [Donghicola sp.]|uniref:zinc ribbon domain-containing protein n=1 Tax=Donghicola sp. TaxID=1929294 RepID=UPI00345C1E7F
MRQAKLRKEVFEKRKAGQTPGTETARRPSYLLSGLLECGDCGSGYSMINQERMGCSAARNKGTCSNRRRPRYLFSKLLVCDCCGGGFSMINKSSFGCTQSRTKGQVICPNRRTIKREELEDRILTALTERLMQPEAVKAFCDAYMAERNRLASSRDDKRSELLTSLSKLKSEKDVLVASIKSGVPAEFLHDEIEENMRRTAALGAELSAEPREDVLRFDPRLAEDYRQRVSALIRSLGDRTEMNESWVQLRGLIEKIILIPDDHDGYTIDLRGDLAGLLNMALGPEVSQAQGIEDVLQFKLVAGVGFEPTTFRL